MSDDLNKKIRQIAEILGQDTPADNIMGLLSLLKNSASKEQPASPAVEPQAPPSEQKQDRSELEANLEMVRKVKKIMERLQQNDDPRITLLTAIKPFLSSRRQKSVSDAIKVLNMSSVAHLLDESDLMNR